MDTEKTDLWIVVHLHSGEDHANIISPAEGFSSEQEAKAWLQQMLALGQLKMPFLEYYVRPL